MDFKTDFEQRAYQKEPIEKRSEELVQLFMDALRKE